MYESFYGFTEKPFSVSPDPAFLYLGARHGVALSMLQYGLMNRAGITVLTGDIGAGKTTLIRRLLDEHDDDLLLGLISNTHESFGNLMQWVAVAFDLPSGSENKAQLYGEFSEFLIEQYGLGRRTILIVDEAQNLDLTTLEELRLLTNINADKDQLLQLILIGQPQLREKLRDPNLEQFVQRIGVDFHLAPLNADDTAGYIKHRLMVANGNLNLFSDRACRLIYLLTNGVPRRINLMCDTALVYGFAEESTSIDIEHISEMVLERACGGLYGAGLVAGQFQDPAQEIAALVERSMQKGAAKDKAD